MDQEKVVQPGLKILLVEDDQEFADILKIRLGKETNPPLEITCLPTLQQAMEALTETTWDLILLDLMMPGLSGEETLRRLREIDPAVPVFVVSGYSEGETMQRCAKLGVSGYLSKPFEIATLVDKIRPHLA